MMRQTLKIKIIALALVLCSSPVFAAKNKCKAEPTKLFELVSKPKDFLNKDIVIEGEFYSFTTIPLDYEKAMRSSKDFIGLILTRPDHKGIPLVELKLAAPLQMFKDQDIEIEHGDKISLDAKVYAVALGEPWLEVSAINVDQKAEKED